MSQLPITIVTEDAQPREFRALSGGQIIKTLDIAVLKPNATLQDITEAAREVERIGAASVCVSSYNVAIAKQVTQRVCSVIGFPHGNMSPDVKRLEAERAIDDGAVELDVVINFGRLLEGREVSVCQELDSIVSLARRNQVLVKTILETHYYEPRQLREACELCAGCGVNWLKTSTGFGPSGAVPWAVEIMLEVAAEWAKRDQIVQVKASGGIKTYEDACMYLTMGCTRLGVGYASYKGLLP
jgi:deoxyribose-phosphate aldolase